MVPGSFYKHRKQFFISFVILRHRFSDCLHLVNPVDNFKVRPYSRSHRSDRRSGRGDSEERDLIQSRGLEGHLFRAVDKVQELWLRGRSPMRTAWAG